MDRSQLTSACERCVLLCLLGLMLTGSGCNLFSAQRKLPPVPETFRTPPQQNELFALVNRRTESVRQLQAETTVGISGVPAKLNGSLILERPNRLRLKVNPLGMESLGADIGSNDQHFWVWVKSGGVMAESVLMFANHQEYAQSPVAAVLPLEPRWVTDALGLITFDASGYYQGPSVRKEDGRLKVVGYESTPRGTLASTMIFDPKTGLLRQKSLYDSGGNLIGYCDLGSYQHFPAEDTAIPTEMKLCFRPGTPQESIASIQLSNIRLNGLYVDPHSAWSMPNPVGIPRVDLSKTPVAPQVASTPAGARTPAEVQSSPSFRGRWLNR